MEVTASEGLPLRIHNRILFSYKKINEVYGQINETGSIVTQAKEAVVLLV